LTSLILNEWKDKSHKNANVSKNLELIANKSHLFYTHALMEKDIKEKHNAGFEGDQVKKKKKKIINIRG
jgi:hypothetical protein